MGRGAAFKPPRAESYGDWSEPVESAVFKAAAARDTVAGGPNDATISPEWPRDAAPADGRRPRRVARLVTRRIRFFATQAQISSLTMCKWSKPPVINVQIGSSHRIQQVVTRAYDIRRRGDGARPDLGK